MCVTTDWRASEEHGTRSRRASEEHGTGSSSCSEEHAGDERRQHRHNFANRPQRRCRHRHHRYPPQQPQRGAPKQPHQQYQHHHHQPQDLKIPYNQSIFKKIFFFSPFSFSLFIISYYLTWRTVICMHACYLLFWECMYALCFCVLGVFFFFNFLCWLIECCNSSCYCNCTALWQSSCLAAIAQWALNEALLYQTILFIFFSFYVWLNLIITCVDNI